MRFNLRNKENTEKSLFFYLSFIWSTIYRYGTGIALSYFFANLMVNLLPQVESYAVSKVIDAAVNEVSNSSATTTSFWKYLAVLCVILWLAHFLYDLRDFITQIFDLRMQNIRDHMIFSKVLALNPQVFEDPNFINVKNKVDYNSWKITGACRQSTNVITSIISATIVGYIFLNYDPKIVLTTLLAVSMPILAKFKFGKRVWGIWDSLSDDKVIYNLYRGKLYTNVPSKFMEIKVFGYGKYLLNKALEINTRFVSSLEQNEQRRMVTTMATRFWEFGFTGLGYYLTFNLFLTQTISLGELFFLLSVFNNMKSSIMFSLDQVSGLMADKPFFATVYDLLNFEPVIKMEEGTKKLTKTKGLSIKFENVWFKYPNTEKWILKGVNFDIPSGKDIALVGKNGAGKSTIIKLLLRIYDPTDGKILINDLDIKELSLEDYYQMVGLLSQEFGQFGFSVSENISIGDVFNKIDQPRVQASAERARADEFIQTYPNLYETFLTRELKDGIIPSGGQWQRIAIARVFYRNPELIVLDEPTSAIDALAEEEIFNNLRDFSREKTSVIVSHRFATVKKADYIYVIDDGRVLEEGTHTQLMENNAMYAQMHNAQQK